MDSQPKPIFVFEMAEIHLCGIIVWLPFFPNWPWFHIEAVCAGVKFVSCDKSYFLSYFYDRNVNH